MTARLTCRPGDLVAIVCPARKLTAGDLSDAVNLLEHWGFRVRLGESVGAEDHQFGGPDSLRASDLMKQLEDPEVRAVFCARGGYGSARLLPLLDGTVFSRNPKWLIGFSDISALHAWALNTNAIPTIHGPMPVLFPTTENKALDMLKNLLFTGTMPPIEAPAHPLNVPGEAKGVLIGGNLSVLYSLRGTPWFPAYEGAVLFLEDLDEYLYHVDRMMFNLELGGVLDRIAGLVIGGMTDMKDNPVPFGRSAEEIIRGRMGSRRIPMAFGFPAGHFPDNRPIILGMPVKLSVGSAGSAAGTRLDFLLTEKREKRS